jgi:hypothetical protein
MILEWSPSKTVSAIWDLRPRWPPQPIAHCCIVLLFTCEQPSEWPWHNSMKMFSFNKHTTLRNLETCWCNTSNYKMYIQKATLYVKPNACKPTSVQHTSFVNEINLSNKWTQLFHIIYIKL